MFPAEGVLFTSISGGVQQSLHFRQVPGVMKAGASAIETYIERVAGIQSANQPGKLLARLTPAQRGVSGQG
jgi:hypothetical protein